MSDFDVQQFIDDVQQEQLESKFVPIPVGDYDAYVKPGSVEVAVISFKEGSENGVDIVLQDGTVVHGGKKFKCKWVINDPALAEQLGLAELVVKQEFLLDLTPTGAIAHGTNRNTRLGKILEAGGILPPWSFRQVEGVHARIRVKHRADQSDPEIKYPEVSSVARA